MNLLAFAARSLRRELRHGGETDETDADQRVGIAGQPEIEVAEQQDGQDRTAPDGQQHAGQIALRSQRLAPGAQQQRHHQIVADHRR